MGSVENRDACNAARYIGPDRHGPQKAIDRGHYESWFQRANHPTKPLAFWIRYTIFSPHNQPQKAVGELWAIFFDGEQGTHTAVRERFPIDQCAFSRHKLLVRVKTATLDAARLEGQATTGVDSLSWSLDYTSPSPSLLLLPNRLYNAPFPKAKALVGSPQAVFSGDLTVNGQSIHIDRWVGSQNHNWGSKHTDCYAWGQVAGFDDHPEAFLECATARVKIGSLWSPWMSLAVLRLGAHTYSWNNIWTALRAKGTYSDAPTDEKTPVTWHLSSQHQAAAVDIRMSAPPSHFVALPYDNPPGGIKVCLNTKIARCDLTLTRPNLPPLTLTSTQRAAFEILTDNAPPHISLRDI